MSGDAETLAAYFRQHVGGPMRHIFGSTEQTDALEVLLDQEAEAFLASDWLAAHDAAIRADAWDEGFKHTAEKDARLPWGDMPYDGKTPREVIDDYVLVRGDLVAEYARAQLAEWVERYAEHKGSTRVIPPGSGDQS